MGTSKEGKVSTDNLSHLNSRFAALSADRGRQVTLDPKTGMLFHDEKQVSAENPYGTTYRQYADGSVYKYNPTRENRLGERVFKQEYMTDIDTRVARTAAEQEMIRAAAATAGTQVFPEAPPFTEEDLRRAREAVDSSSVSWEDLRKGWNADSVPKPFPDTDKPWKI